MARKRLMHEFSEITKCPPENCSAQLKDDNIFEWICTIDGPIGSVYEGGIFTLNIRFSINYPFHPPNVKFLTKIYHCNISTNGRICIDILKDNWSPAWTISTLLLGIQLLLCQCNPDDPLVYNIAQMYKQNKTEHDRRARACTNRYAKL